MAVQVSYPGVYIDEFAPGAPIQGVGTSTAAFIGPASNGELDSPTKVTSWDQFKDNFGAQPLPGFYMWYAVRGFFETGGQVVYIVRASNGTYAALILQDRAGNNIARVRATQPGVPTPAIQIQVTGTHIIQGADTSLYQPTGNYTITTNREITLSSPEEAAQFRPGDWVNLGAADTRVQVLRVMNDRLRLTSDLTGAVGNAGAIRLADASGDTRTVRIMPTNVLPRETLVAGTILTMTQGGNSISQIVETVQSEPLQTNPPITTYRVTFRQGIGSLLSLDPANAATVQSEEFTVNIIQGSTTISYPNLSVDSAHPRYFIDIVNRANGPVRLELIEPLPPVQPPQNLPVNVGPAGFDAATPGTPEDLTSIGDQDYIEALETLRDIDDVNLIAIPDVAPDPAALVSPVQQAIIAHCEQLGDRFGVLDSLRPGRDLQNPDRDQPLFGNNSIEQQRLGLDSTRGYAALYYPWIRVLPFGSGNPILVPPSGHVCGIIARSDNVRGVHKAPANEIVNGALGVGRNMSDVDQGQLNLQGINVIRMFQAGGRPVLWGARTTATDLNWQYVNIRRLFLYVEESIQEGIRWAVFEPNNLQLWQKLKRTITEFLTRVWRDGALFGATVEEAFYVRIDEALNPFSEQALGRLHIEIGLRPTYPAEFIIVRIGIWSGGSEVSEG